MSSKHTPNFIQMDSIATNNRAWNWNASFRLKEGL